MLATPVVGGCNALEPCLYLGRPVFGWLHCVTVDLVDKNGWFRGVGMLGMLFRRA